MKRLIVSFLASSLLATSLSAQGASAGSPATPENKGNIQLSATAFGLFEDQDVLQIRSGEEEVGEIRISPRHFGPQTFVSARDLVFGVSSEEGAFRPLAKVTLPSQGARFALLFFPRSNGYTVRVIRSDDPEFRASDSVIFNLTGGPIGVVLGTNRLQVAPGKRAIMRPGVAADQAVYTASFYFQRDGSPAIFQRTRWRASDRVKRVVIVYQNPDESKPTYRTFSLLANG